MSSMIPSLSLPDRLAAAQTPWGRWRLNSWCAVRRWAWRRLASDGEHLKRVFDVIASTAFLAAACPVFLLVAILIKLEDGGPVFFMQTRVGKFGRHFRIYKFRS